MMRTAHSNLSEAAKKYYLTSASTAFLKTAYWNWCVQQALLKETTLPHFSRNSTILKYHTSQNWNRQQIQEYSKDVDITHRVSWLSAFLHRRWNLWLDSDGYLVHCQWLGLHGGHAQCRSRPRGLRPLPLLIWGRVGLKNRTIRRSTKQTKIICETQIILK